MKIKYASLLVLGTLLLWGCDDNTAGLGLGMFPGGDKNINGQLHTFDVTTESVSAGNVYAKTNIGYVGKFTDSDFGTYQAGFLAELNCPEKMTFPEVFSGNYTSGKGQMMTDFSNLADGVGGNYTLIKGDNGQVIGNCQINIYLWYDSYFGDSLTACRLSMYELDKQKENKYWNEDSKTYYTNIDPTDYYDATKSLLGSKSYTAVDLSLSDSIRNLSSYSPYIKITLNQEKTQELGKELLQKGRSSDFYSHFKDVFPGIYVKSDYGDGTILYVSSVQMDVAFLENARDSITGGKLKTSAGKDSVVYNGRSFNSTREVIQANQLTNDKEAIDAKINDRSCTYLKSPAGIFTQATLPIDAIEEELQGDTLNAVQLTFNNYNQPTKNFGMDIPSNVLLIRKGLVETFFEKNQLNDNISSYLTSHTSSTNQYAFSNITRLVNACIAEKEAAKKAAGSSWNEQEWMEANPDWDKVLLIPVLLTYDSSSSSSSSSSYYYYYYYGTSSSTSSQTIIGIQHDLKPGYVKLKGGLDNKLQLEVISTHFGATRQ